MRTNSFVIHLLLLLYLNRHLLSNSLSEMSNEMRFIVVPRFRNAKPAPILTPRTQLKGWRTISVCMKVLTPQRSHCVLKNQIFNKISGQFYINVSKSIQRGLLLNFQFLNLTGLFLKKIYFGRWLETKNVLCLYTNINIMI